MQSWFITNWLLIIECNLGDVLDSEGGVERAVGATVAAAWGMWRDQLSSNQVAVCPATRVQNNTCRIYRCFSTENSWWGDARNEWFFLLDV